MLADMGHDLGLHLLSLWVLANLRHQQGVLHHGRVHSDVGVVVLVNERLGGLAIQERHVLRDRIAWLHVVLDWHQLVRVLHAQHLDHLAVELRQVINLGGLRGQLDDRLVLHDPLRHGGAVGIGHGDHVHHVVVFLLGLGVAALWGVGVLARGVVADDVLEELELLLHRVVHTRLHGRHGFELALKDGQCGAHGRVGAHVADLHVRNRAQPAGFVGDLVEQREQDL